MGKTIDKLARNLIKETIVLIVQIWPPQIKEDPEKK